MENNHIVIREDFGKKLLEEYSNRTGNKSIWNEQRQLNAIKLLMEIENGEKKRKQCDTNRCACKKAGLLCNLRCHGSGNCKNK